MHNFMPRYPFVEPFYMSDVFVLDHKSIIKVYIGKDIMSQVEYELVMHRVAPHSSLIFLVTRLDSNHSLNSQIHRYRTEIN